MSRKKAQKIQIVFLIFVLFEQFFGKFSLTANLLPISNYFSFALIALIAAKFSSLAETFFVRG